MESTTQPSAKKRVCGKYCVAGGPGQVSCTNSSLTPGISMHLFPADVGLRRQWTKFVQKHRPGFKPTKTSVLCSNHFTSDCFTRRLDLCTDENVSTSRRLEKGSVPTINASYESNNAIIKTDRERRKVSEK